MNKLWHTNPVKSHLFHLFQVYSFNKSSKSINQGEGGCYPLNKVRIPEGTKYYWMQPLQIYLLDSKATRGVTVYKDECGVVPPNHPFCCTDAHPPRNNSALSATFESRCCTSKFKIQLKRSLNQDK